MGAAVLARPASSTSPPWSAVATCTETAQRICQCFVRRTERRLGRAGQTQWCAWLQPVHQEIKNKLASRCCTYAASEKHCVCGVSRLCAQTADTSNKLSNSDNPEPRQP